MKYEIFFAEHFKKQLESHRKKYRSIARDVIKVLEEFDKKQAQFLGAQTYKIRVRSSDMARGKSHAFRMVILVLEIENTLAPIIIYFKGDKANVGKEEILYHKDRDLYDVYTFKNSNPAPVSPRDFERMNGRLNDLVTDLTFKYEETRAEKNY